MATGHSTFAAFTPEQAAQYASGRGYSYPPDLYKAIIDYHTGGRDLLLDVGTGPGKVAFDLLPYFEYAIGCDLGPNMIGQAEKDAMARGVSDKTHFVVCGGEECNKALVESGHDSADVVTVAMAAHWLDMPGFYEAAGKALRPGGTLAIWTCTSIYIHPSEANAEAIQDAIHDMDDRMLLEYRNKGSMQSRQAYENLPLPWTIDGDEHAFENASFIRKDWDREGVPSSPPRADGTPGPFLLHKELSLVDLEKALRSSSAVIKWREAHPSKAFSDEDPVILTVRRLKELSGGKEGLILSPSCSLLLMRRK